jgi:hypothetical protein
MLHRQRRHGGRGGGSWHFAHDHAVSTCCPCRPTGGGAPRQGGTGPHQHHSSAASTVLPAAATASRTSCSATSLATALEILPISVAAATAGHRPLTPLPMSHLQRQRSLEGQPVLWNRNRNRRNRNFLTRNRNRNRNGNLFKSRNWNRNRN